MIAQIATDLSSLSISSTDSTLAANRSVEQNNNVLQHRITQPYNNNNNNNCNTVRDVHRAGWLRFVTFDESSKWCNKSSTDSSSEHRFWVVFSVYNESQPYLEFYEKSQELSSQSWKSGKQNGGPVSTHSLMRCVHISPAIISSYHSQSSKQQNTSKEKKRTRDEFAITLDTHVIRLVADNQNSMQDWIDTIKNKLRQLGVLQPQDNLYTKDPQLFPSRSSIRPLPPVPSEANSAMTATDTQPSSSQRSSLLLRSDEESSDELYETIFNATNINNNTNNTNNTNNSNNLTEPLSNVDIPDEEGPPPYESISQTTNNRPLMSLRQSQVLRLHKEISHRSGVRLMVRKNDCDNTIALVNMFGSVWIAGWKQKHHPYLHNTFHIGDQLICVNNKPVDNASHAYHAIKQSLHTIELIVRRVPYGKVLFIKRQTDGQNIGIVREENSARVSEVLANGLADRAGLSKKCRYLSATGDEVECNWCFTEINNRPLNLWFKNNEIETRLNSVGREISILVQPIMFVKQLKKHLKQFRSYKEYIVQ